MQNFLRATALTILLGVTAAQAATPITFGGSFVSYPGSSGTTRAAATCAAADIATQVTASSDGDTVTLPAGTCTYTGAGTALTISKGIFLVGAGAGYTQGLSTNSYAVPSSYPVTGVQFTLRSPRDGTHTNDTINSWLTDFQVNDNISVIGVSNSANFNFQATVTAWNSSTGVLTITVTGATAGAGNTFAVWTFQKAPTTQIICNTTGGNANPCLNFTSSTGKSLVVSGIDFHESSSTASDVIWMNGTSGTNPPVILHDNGIFVTQQNSTYHTVRHGNLGIVYSNYVYSPLNAFNQTSNFENGGGFDCKTGPASSWTTGNTMGSLDTAGTTNFYFEQNIVTDIGVQALDSDDQCRAVYRYNGFNHSATSTHGDDTSANGLRHIEYYGNTYYHVNRGGSGTNPNMDYLLFVRGGTLAFWGNQVDSLNTGGQWGAKAAIKFVVMSLRRDDNVTSCWAGPYIAPANTTSFGAGVYQETHQVGQGYESGALNLDPARVWNNTGNMNDTNGALDAVEGTDYASGIGPSGDDCYLNQVPLGTGGGTIAGGTLYTNGTYTNVPLTGGTGGNGSHPAKATVTIAGGAITNVNVTYGGGDNKAVGYTNGDVLTSANSNLGGTGSGFTYTLTSVTATHGPVYTSYINENTDWYFCTNSTCARPGYSAYTYPHPLRPVAAVGGVVAQ